MREGPEEASEAIEVTALIVLVLATTPYRGLVPGVNEKVPGKTDVRHRARTLLWVGFQPMGARRSEIFLRVEPSGTFNLVPGAANQVVIDLVDTRPHTGNELRIVDTSHFDSAVRSVIARKHGRDTRVVIDLHGTVGFDLREETGYLVLQFGARPRPPPVAVTPTPEPETAVAPRTTARASEPSTKARRGRSLYTDGPLWYPERPKPAESGDGYELELALTLWNENPSGEVVSSTDTSDLEEDLALDRGVGTGFRVLLAHPVRWLPDLELAFTPLAVQGSELLDEPLTFEGVTFREGQVVDTGLALDTLDLLVFWRPVRLRRVFQLRLGLLGRNLDGIVFVRARVASTASELAISVPVIPMGYLALSTQPIDWVSLRVQVRGVAFQESRWIDGDAVLRAWLGENVFLGAGYRYQTLVLRGQGAADADAVVQGVAGEFGMRF